VKLLEGKLADEFLEVRVRASKALLDLGKDGNGIEDCAVSGLLSEDSRVRRWGLEVLLRLGTRARGSVSKVEAIATEDPDRELRQLARWTLARLR